MACREIEYINTADFTKLEKLGEGTYGIVYKVKRRSDNQIFALKKIRLEADEEGIPATALREIVSLRELSHHANFVQLMGLQVEEKQLGLLFEYMDYDLKKFMDETKRQQAHKYLDGELVKSYGFQLIQGMQEAHRRRFLHRDLKPQNLLVDNNGIIKIADLGLVRSVAMPVRQYTHEIVTLWYRSPEVLLGVARYTDAVDVWSIGCILAEMLKMGPLFQGDSEIDQIYKIFRICGTPTNDSWPGVEQLKDWKPSFPKWNGTGLEKALTGVHINENEKILALDLLSKLLCMSPDQRISCGDALHHPFFDTVDLETLPQALNTQDLDMLVTIRTRRAEILAERAGKRSQRILQDVNIKALDKMETE